MQPAKAELDAAPIESQRILEEDYSILELVRFECSIHTYRILLRAKICQAIIVE